MRLIDADTAIKFVKENTPCINGETTMKCVERSIKNAPTIEAKPIVHAHWISASWEEDEKDGIENTYSDEFICSNCKEHLYFPDVIEKEDIGFSFCPYCGAQMDERKDDNG